MLDKSIWYASLVSVFSITILWHQKLQKHEAGKKGQDDNLVRAIKKK